MMPLGAVTGTIEWLAPYMASKHPGYRTWIMFVSQCGTTMPALLLWMLPRHATGGLLFGIYFLASLGGMYSILMGLQMTNTAGKSLLIRKFLCILNPLGIGYTKKSLSASWVFLGFCLGNITGPLLFKEEDAPRYVPGWIAVVITSIITSILALVYRYISIWDNRRKDKAGILEDFEHAYEDDLTDMKVGAYYQAQDNSFGSNTWLQNPQFRYQI
jgi:hypothetical protein